MIQLTQARYDELLKAEQKLSELRLALATAWGKRLRQTWPRAGKLELEYDPDRFGPQPWYITDGYHHATGATPNEAINRFDQYAKGVFVPTLSNQWNWISARFDGMKTSEAVLFLELLGLDASNPYAFLGQFVDAAMVDEGKK